MFKDDRSLRIALWIIAISLAVIALRPLVVIDKAQAQSPLDKIIGAGQGKQKESTPPTEQLGAAAASGRIVPFGIQGGGAFWAYDRETLAIYLYDVRDGQGYYLGKLSQLGKPMDQSGVRNVPFLR